MRLTELDPQWLVKDGKRIGFIFRSPKQSERVRHDGSIAPNVWYQSCFPQPTSHALQDELFDAIFGEDKGHMSVQCCNPGSAWTIAGGIENATFENMSVTPSLDGSAGGLWHGFITNGEIK